MQLCQYRFTYDTSWRVIATRRYTDTAASVPAYKDRTIYHNAGLGGYGGYNDAVLMRDADLTNSWSGAADGTAGSTPTRRVGCNIDRQYQCSNWRGDVVAILDDAGRMIEQVRYTPYGVPFALPAGDSDSDGDWDGTDVINIGGGYDIREDSDLDGDADFDDFTHSNNRAGGSALYLGWKFLSSAYCANRKGYASYEHDPAAPATLAHVRYRVYNFTLGRWIQRDPAGYVDGPNLYGYVGAMAVVGMDPDGLATICTRPWTKPNPIPHIPSITIQPGIGLPKIVTPKLYIPKILVPNWNIGPVETGHFYVCFDDGTSVGWGPNSPPCDENYADDVCPCKGGGKEQYDDYTMKQAVVCCCDKGGGGFCASEGYKYPSNDCQDFSKCVVAQYKNLSLGGACEFED